MVQAGPVIDLYIPRDRESQKHKGYGFAEYDTEESAQYAVNLFSGLLILFDRPVKISVRLTNTLWMISCPTFPSTCTGGRRQVLRMLQGVALQCCHSLGTSSLGLLLQSTIGKISIDQLAVGRSGHDLDHAQLSAVTQ